MYVSNIIMIPNDPVLFKNSLKKKKKQNPKSERLNWLKKKKKRERESKQEKEKKKENGINKPKQGKLLRTF